MASTPLPLILEIQLEAQLYMQEKPTSTVEVTTNFVKKFKAHFEKNFALSRNYFFRNIKIFHGNANSFCL